MKWLCRASHRGLFLGLVDYASAVELASRFEHLIMMIHGSSGTIFERLWERQMSYQTFPSDDFHDLFTRAWFQRVWTFQEIMLVTDAVLICGSTVAKWDHVVRGTQLCRERSRLVTPSNDTLLDLRKVCMNVERSQHWDGQKRNRNLEARRSDNAYQRKARTKTLNRLGLGFLLMMQSLAGIFVFSFTNCFFLLFTLEIIPAIVKQSVGYFVYIDTISPLVFGILAALSQTVFEFTRLSNFGISFSLEPRGMAFGIELFKDDEDYRETEDIFRDGVIQVIRERVSTD